MDTLQMCILLFGGLGLFLFGMNMMGDGLQNVAGDKLKVFFEKLTSNPIKGVLTGAIITAIIQSSSATTVMVVGFVNAQLMNLFQATAVIMGANIGTTITSQLIALDIQAIVPIFVGVGALVTLFAKKNSIKQIGYIILGFGILFSGMDIMKTSMEPLADSPLFMELIKNLDGNVALGILTGLIMTGILQSSSATTGILIALSGSGLLTIHMIIPVLFGCNIGTCVTSLLSSIGTSKTAKKAAVIHLMFNVIGTVIFIPLFGFLAHMVTDYPLVGSLDIKRQIANAHTIFNVVNTIILLPFTALLVKAANKIIRGEDEEERYGVKYIDERLLETPPIALAQTIKDIERMATKAKENLELSMDAFKSGDKKLIEKCYKNEKLINLLEEEITQYLVSLTKRDITDKDHSKIVTLLSIVNEIERIGDHADNIAEFAESKANKKLEMSKDAEEELSNMSKLTLESLELTVSMFENPNAKTLDTISFLENKIDHLEHSLRKSHIDRLNKGVCNATIGTLFLDIVNTLERVSDHSINIADSWLHSDN